MSDPGNDGGTANRLKEEYAFVTDQFRAVWQTWANTFTIAVSGIVIGLILVTEKYPSSGPVFIMFPPILVGWYVMMDLQGKELAGRKKYMAILEERIREETGQPFPCYESRFQCHLYSTWRFVPLKYLVGMPVLLMYVFASYKALTYIRGSCPNWFLPALGAYILCPVVAVMLAWRNGRAIIKELRAITMHWKKG